MNARNKREIKDAFMAYALNRSKYFSPKEFLSDHPEYNITYSDLIQLLKEMLNYNEKLFQVLSGNGMEFFMVTPGPALDDFRDEGGFQKLYENEEREWSRLMKNVFESRSAGSSEKVLHNWDNRYVRRTFWYYMFVAMAVVSFVYCSYLFLMQLL